MPMQRTDGGIVTDKSFEDSEFTPLAVSLGVNDTFEAITEAVKGLHASDAAVGTKIRTTDGMLVAVVQATDTDDTAVVHYRTEPAADLATRKGKKIGRTLEAFEADSEQIASP